MIILIFFIDPPRIDRIPDALYLPEGDNSKIKIFYSGDQPMDVFLNKDGEEVSQTPHIKYTVFDDYIIIFIKEITKEDAGTYSLTVKNQSGSVSGSFTVYITGKYVLLLSLLLDILLAYLAGIMASTN